MFENMINFFKKLRKKEANKESSDTAKERLHLVLMQDRANVSADFLELMKQEIIEVIKKYIDVDEAAIDVKLTNKANEDGTVGAPALYANIPIITIKNDARKVNTPKESSKNKEKKEEPSKQAIKDKQEEKQEPSKEQENEEKQEESKEPNEPTENEEDQPKSTIEQTEEPKQNVNSWDEVLVWRKKYYKTLSGEF